MKQSTTTYTKRVNARRAGVAAGIPSERVALTVHKNGDEVRLVPNADLTYGMRIGNRLTQPALWRGHGFHRGWLPWVSCSHQKTRAAWWTLLAGVPAIVKPAMRLPCKAPWVSASRPLGPGDSESPIAASR